jgi:hypothetical protein
LVYFVQFGCYAPTVTKVVSVFVRFYYVITSVDDFINQAAPRDFALTYSLRWRVKSNC